ncbi:MAG: response regulator [Polyangiales bacterium]
MDAAAQRELTVLVVDDDVAAATLFSKLLARHGHRVSTATSVRGALEQLRSACTQVLLSDWNLDDGDASQLLSAFRAQGGLVAIALTGLSLGQDHQQIHACGFDQVLSKPARFEAVQQAILERFADASEARQGGAQPPRSPRSTEGSTSAAPTAHGES